MLRSAIRRIAALRGATSTLLVDGAAQQLKGTFHHNGGHCWVAELPDVAPGDGTGPFPSCLQLYEDDRPLGPAHTGHAEIRERGGGGYSHWNRQLYFSSSDNTNPNTNQRSYTIQLKLSTDFDRLAEAGINNVAVWLWHLGPDYDLAGKTVCEIGPGDTLSSLLVMVGLGADCIAVDRVSPTWDAANHPLLIEAICRLAPSRLGRQFYPERLQCCISENRFAFVRTFAKGLEAAGHDVRGIADLTVSASAMEHVEDFQQATVALHSISKAGGLGVHCIDLRDHSNFDRPLEFLLYSTDEYDALTMDYRYVRGNRVRPSQIMRTVEEVGFFASRFVGHLESDVGYRADVQQRLSTSNSPFRFNPPDDLRYLNGVLRLAKAGVLHPPR